MSQCQDCGADMKTVPAGVSKRTGKAYRSFEVCETKDCKEKKEIRRSQVPFTPQNTPQLNFEASQAIQELRAQIGDLNLVIQNMRTAFANHEARIKALEPTDNIPDDFFEKK